MRLATGLVAASAALAASVGAPFWASVLGSGAASARTRQADTFTSGGVPISVERFDPGSQGGASRPAILLLHGSDGPGERYREAARMVAAAGYRVFLVHYLDRTGEARASYGSIGSNLPVWAETVYDAVTWVSGEPGVDPRRIGILGVSLGGGLALAEASQDPRVGALVDYYGFVPSTLSASVTLPPTLILHGDADRVVPVSNARTLEALLSAGGIAHETVIYPGQGHGFSGDAQVDAARRITAFFDRYLRGSAHARP